jgi:hypothetical protein
LVSSLAIKICLLTKCGARSASVLRFGEAPRRKTETRRSAMSPSNRDRAEPSSAGSRKKVTQKPDTDRAATTALGPGMGDRSWRSWADHEPRARVRDGRRPASETSAMFCPAASCSVVGCFPSLVVLADRQGSGFSARASRSGEYLPPRLRRLRAASERLKRQVLRLPMGVATTRAPGMGLKRISIIECWTRSRNMPLYEYECDACGRRFERIVKFSDPSIETARVRRCRPADGPLPRYSIQRVRLYITDYAREGR